MPLSAWFFFNGQVQTRECLCQAEVSRHLCGGGSINGKSRDLAGGAAKVGDLGQVTPL